MTRRESAMRVAPPRTLARASQRARRTRALGSLGSAALASCLSFACGTDDDDTFAGADRPDSGSGGSGAVVTPRDAGTPPNAAGGADAGPTSGPDGDAGVDIDGNVFRPEERPATPELIAGLSVPPGFRIIPFAEQVDDARMLAVRGSYVYVTRPEPGDVLRLEDTDADGRADERATVASGLPFVHGIVFAGDQVYLATDTQVLQASVDESGGFGATTVLIDDLPDGGQHPLRTLAIGPDDRLYISVGSSCDACAESNPEHATLLVATLDGTTRSVFARGLRNTIGFAWHPDTGQLWGMDHGSDGRGDDVPPEELNAINEGADYGWPYCFGDRQPDPLIDDPPDTTKAAYCAGTVAPTLTTQAHEAPIGLTFYTGGSFPFEHRDDAFVAMHGSWNRLPPAGYKVVRVVFEAGAPVAFEDFVTGFLIEDGAATFGRPAGITMATDGALLFSDDTSGVIYRVEPSEGLDAGVLPPPPDAGAAD